jgi:uncharacterized membrane protein
MNRIAVTTRDQWLRRLEWALSALPVKDRDDIVRETRSHIEERLAQGMSEQQVLASLGDGDDYAQSFLDEFELSRALGSRRLPEMTRVAAAWAHRSIAAAAAFTWVLLIALYAAGVVLTAVMDFVDPVHWGFWVSKHMVLIGHVDDPAVARELLGAGIYPFAVGSLIVCWISGRSALLGSLRIVARRSPSNR